MNFYPLRYVLLLLCLLLAAYATPVLSCEVLIISANTKNPPISFEQNGFLKGIGFDLMERLLSGLEIPVKRTMPLPWKRALLRSKKGEIDILIGVHKSSDRAQYLEFIEPAFTRTAHTVFFKQGGRVKISSKEDLRDYVGGSTFGSVLDEGFAEYMAKHFELQEVGSVEQNFLKLMAERIDYFIAPLLPTIHIVQTRYPQKIKHLTFLDDPISVTDEYIAISKNSDCAFVNNKLQERLKEVKRNGTFDKWLGSSMASWQSFDWYIEHQD